MGLRKTTMFLSLFSIFMVSLPLSLATQLPPINNNSRSLSFPITSLSLSRNSASALHPSLFFKTRKSLRPTSSSLQYDYKIPFRYSTALVVSLPIGTPPQTQDMVLDTGSQLSWIQCHKKVPPPMKNPKTASFDPSLSSSFSVLPCNHPLCKPRVPDFTLPTMCDQNRLCHYSYFYADGTLAEGNLVREKFTFSSSVSTPPLILGCAQDSGENRGILGMNSGRLSFISQAKISKFSYCVPTRTTGVVGSAPTGSLYLGDNPNSATFKYVELLTFPESQRSPNLDPLAYSVPLRGIKIGGKRLNISASAFRPDAGGSGQTIIDSGSDLSYLVDEAYNQVREEVLRLVGPKIKKDYVYAGVSDICFDGGDAMEIERLIGDMVFEFDNVEILIQKGRVLTDVENDIKCVAIGRSDMLGIASNIIGNFHQQNIWVEFDLANKKIGFSRPDCTQSL